MSQPPGPPAGPPGGQDPGPWAAPGAPQPGAPGAPQPGAPGAPQTGAPGAPQPAPPPQAPVYGAPPPSYADAPGPGPAYGEAPPGYGQPPPPRKRPVWPWVLGGVGCLVLLVIGAVIAAIVVFAQSDVVDDIDEGIGSEQGDSYGDNPELDALWDDCEAGDGLACDELFRLSEVGSEYEDFGDTCGGRLPAGTICAEEDLN